MNQKSAKRGVPGVVLRELPGDCRGDCPCFEEQTNSSLPATLPSSPSPSTTPSTPPSTLCREAANGVFAPYRKQGVLTQMANMMNGHSIHKSKGIAPQTPETTKMTKMAGVTHAKTLVAKNPVFAPLIVAGLKQGGLLMSEPENHRRYSSYRWCTEQAKANLDPRVGSTSGVTNPPTRAPMRAPTKVDFPCSKPFEDSPQKVPRKKKSHEGLHGSTHEKCPRQDLNVGA